MECNSKGCYDKYTCRYISASAYKAHICTFVDAIEPDPEEAGNYNVAFGIQGDMCASSEIYWRMLDVGRFFILSKQCVSVNAEKCAIDRPHWFYIDRCFNESSFADLLHKTPD